MRRAVFPGLIRTAVLSGGSGPPQFFGPKDAADVDSFAVDMSAILESDDVLLPGSAAVAVVSKNRWPGQSQETTPLLAVSGTVAVSGAATVAAVLGGGTGGVAYDVFFGARTMDGETLWRHANVQVEAPLLAGVFSDPKNTRDVDEFIGDFTLPLAGDAFVSGSVAATITAVPQYIGGIPETPPSLFVSPGTVMAVSGESGAIGAAVSATLVSGTPGIAYRISYSGNTVSGRTLKRTATVQVDDFSPIRGLPMQLVANMRRLVAGGNSISITD